MERVGVEKLMKRGERKGWEFGDWRQENGVDMSVDTAR
jgi:hypothetical protein